jgi:hypothetical protein
VLHTTDGSLDGTVDWFTSEKSGVSAHYLVGIDGSVLQFVNEEDTARHAGPDTNPWTIGVEFEDAGEPATSRRSNGQYEAGARLIREISHRWNIPLDTDHILPHRMFNPKKTCPGNLDIERLLRQARTPESPVICLLPVRNGAHELEGYLASASRYCDAVVALDDGSTDGTRELLESRLIVKVVLTNPRREGFAGWDDGANRNRLLQAAAELSPEWIISIDADERIDASDAAALREFLDTDAVPGCAYGFQHLRMWGENHYDPKFTWIYRLFAFEPDQTLPAEPLHFNPVPTAIPRSRWIRTTIRVQHLGSRDDEARLARLAKYGEVDPEGRYRKDYGRLGEVPTGELPEWKPRPEEQQVLYAPPRGRGLDETGARRTKR